MGVRYGNGYLPKKASKLSTTASRSDKLYRRRIRLSNSSINLLLSSDNSSDNRRSLAQICGQIPMTAVNWYKIESEETKALPIETLRRIEQVLGIDLDVHINA